MKAPCKTAVQALSTAMVLGALFSAGCASTQYVQLEGPNGEVVHCGPPYGRLGFLIEGGQTTEREMLNKCIADREREGYRRTTPPSESAKS
jgi:hypothetical protein